ncbi:Hypothetical protein NGAL_HAMBI1145_59710 [Neorhizobium galegae bv. officinalis]|uniref:Uncharacterized protein n=1 Tax=Neorhizobium galegae bv. officinalis TaxID=323656 RepID=A0A0T7G2U3_NEOGA|nr:hypothetical protein [Neorhizobium galegae]CDZ41596.1 Hypothetical protein NGAL_HAMBI1145_59710 [Neorhizobium galegae bv. officinalis]
MIRYTSQAQPDASPLADKRFTAHVATSPDPLEPTAALTAVPLLEAELRAIAMPTPEPLELSSELPPKKASKRPTGAATKRKTTSTPAIHEAGPMPVLMLNLDV